MNKNFIKKVKDCVIQLEPSAQLFLFGSRARNDYSENSDWDFLVLVDGEMSIKRADRIRHKLYEIEWETGEVISTIIKCRKLWDSPDYRVLPFRREVEREGVLL